MSESKVDPAWLQRQLDRFTDEDMDEAVRLIRAYDRADREAARRESARKASAA
ncbi:hypothetical protein [Nocardia brasiliensis]|uniref:hypothetical protein n=1 Tax=Nocardia brasiliensis TaxID=37326 RepID=UPI002457557E|nr:hypothetical protein [Nocardia brasiliensis]